MGIEIESNNAESGETSVHLWSTILKEVANARIGRIPHGKGIIVLGDNGAGKSTLISRLSHKTVPPKTPGLEYHYIDIRDEATDGTSALLSDVILDQTKLNAWVLDGDPLFVPFLKFTLDSKNFTDRVVVIVADMDRPWNIMEVLEKWSKVLEDYIQSIDIDVEDMREYQDNLIRQFQHYVETDALHLHSAATNGSPMTPVRGSSKSSGAMATSTPTQSGASSSGLHPATAALLGLGGPKQQEDSVSDDAIDGDKNAAVNSVALNGKISKQIRNPSDVLKELPITPGALTNNLGIPMIVVVNKTDVMDDLEKTRGMTEEQFDIIQMHIRRFCLSYGASLIYVSAKNGKNCGLLNNYIQHRVYGFPFTQSAYVIDKDSVFIPTGWDSLKKISLLEQNLTRYKPGDDYSTVVPKPTGQTSVLNDEPHVTSMDDQASLYHFHLYTVLQRDAVTSGAGDTGNDSSIHDQSSILDGSGTPTSRPSSGSATRGRTSGAGVAGALSGSSSEKVLASFFNNLLSKGPSARQAPSMPPSSLAGQAAPSEVANGQSEVSNMTAKEMQSELERLARTSKEALDKSQGNSEKSPATGKS
ncbi:unnamed protein product [Rodentolepis nana]|uniref:Dynein light intermediate chain n=1 Tax=Rodentolepis nana TaxID=102285 RepID=A0A0R3T0S7_RODNA|nr:unnamed protein product [Rodentolepis nana]